jgi:hypothetical protein
MKEHEQHLKEREIGDFIEGLLAEGYVIERADDVRELYKAKCGQDLPLNQIKRIMREHLGLRYSKIINVAVQANSDRCRIQR